MPSDSEPRTEAGTSACGRCYHVLDEHEHGGCFPTDPYGSPCSCRAFVPSRVALERLLAEARADAIRAAFEGVAEQVRRMTDFSTFGAGVKGGAVSRRVVLALLSTKEEGS